MRISQREARRLKKENELLREELRNQRHVWSSEFPGGVHVGIINNPADLIRVAVLTSRKLGHAVIATVNSEQNLLFHALPLPEKYR